MVRVRVEERADPADLDKPSAGHSGAQHRQHSGAEETLFYPLALNLFPLQQHGKLSLLDERCIDSADGFFVVAGGDADDNVQFARSLVGHSV